MPPSPGHRGEHCRATTCRPLLSPERGTRSVFVRGRLCTVDRLKSMALLARLLFAIWSPFYAAGFRRTLLKGVSRRPPQLNRISASDRASSPTAGGQSVKRRVFLAAARPASRDACNEPFYSTNFDSIEHQAPARVMHPRDNVDAMAGGDISGFIRQPPSVLSAASIHLRLNRSL